MSGEGFSDLFVNSLVCRRSALSKDSDDIFLTRRGLNPSDFKTLRGEVRSQLLLYFCLTQQTFVFYSTLVTFTFCTDSRGCCGSVSCSRVLWQAAARARKSNRATRSTSWHKHFTPLVLVDDHWIVLRIRLSWPVPRQMAAEFLKWTFWHQWELFTSHHRFDLAASVTSNKRRVFLLPLQTWKSSESSEA